MSADRRRDEARLLDMISATFQRNVMYFASGIDITHSLQRLATMRGTPTSSLAVWRRAKTEFFWNSRQVEVLAAAGPGADAWITPCMCGLVESRREAPVDGQMASLLLISRRSCLRTGLRYTARGLDEHGNAANFVETEQIVLHSSGHVSSYVQTRGSIPVMWTQRPDMKYTPRVHLLEPVESDRCVAAYTSHFDTQLDTYGDNCAVNLIDRKGGQLMLGEAFEAAVDGYSKARPAGSKQFEFVWFDFHKECAKMQWQHLSKLLKSVSASIQRFGLFMMAPDGEVTSWQTGVFRTNCLDNLDRTNVVQSLFARQAALAGVHVASKGVPVSAALAVIADMPDVLNSSHSAFEYEFKNLWANNADTMSILYSGTPALKTDFTRTGSRTLNGALRDGWHSMQRYVGNNLVDGRTHDAWDVFLGKYRVGRDARYRVKESPLRAMEAEDTPLSVLSKLALLWFGVAATVAAGIPPHSVFLMGNSWGARMFVGASVAGILFSVATYFQVSKGVGLGRAITTRPHFLTREWLNTEAAIVGKKTLVKERTSRGMPAPGGKHK
jgi:hypothetical protein